MKTRQDYLKNIEKLKKNKKAYANFLKNIVNNPLDYYERFLLISFKKGQRVLDYGCGTGKLLMLLKKRFPELSLFGCDINEKLINECKTNPKLKGVNLSLICENKKTPFSDSFFDVVFLLDVLEHAQNPAWVLREINRILKKGGKLIINTPDRLSLVLDSSFYGNICNFLPFNLKRLFGKVFLEYTHRKEFSFREIKVMVEKSGFKIVKSNHKEWIYNLPLLHRDSIRLVLEKN